MYPSKSVGPLLLSVALVTGCVDTAVRIPDAGPADAMPSASCVEAADHSDLPWIEANVITPSC
ncbi:MAG TPA: hypothetical protein VML75_01365, partial [Kofleriaceae bacterium]|nr:hypothetical protein [Kofleriaceae bacterium]